MNIRNQILLALLFVGAVLFLATTFAVHSIIIGNVQTLENRNAEAIISGIDKNLYLQGDFLLRACADWSNWDNTYRFVIGQNPDFTSVDFTNTTLVNLSSTFFMILDKNGDLYYVESLLDGAQENTVVNGIVDSKEFIPDNEAWFKRGYTELSGLPMLVVAKPILWSNYTGPIAGTLVWGKELSSEVLSDILPISGTQVELKLEPSSTGVTPSNYGIAKLSTTQLSGSLYLSGFRNLDGIRVTTLFDRNVYNQTFTATNQFLFVWAVINSILIIACMRLLDTRLIKQFKDINNQVSKIDVKKTLTPIIYEKTNEITQIVNGINMLLSEIETNRRMIDDSQRLAAIGQTASMVGHDLRNPLQTITLTNYLIKKNLSEDVTGLSASRLEKLNGFLDNIEGQTKYMDKIVGDLQSYSNFLQLKLEKSNILENVQNTLASIPIPHNIHVRVEANPLLPLVEIDISMINRVLHSLVLNAVQAMPSGGEIRIFSEVVEGNVVVSIQDNGSGIAESDFPKLFSPFFTTKAKGAGLGLTSSRKLVEAHGGVLSYESKQGLGSRFFFSIPLKKSTDEPPSNPFITRAVI